MEDIVAGNEAAFDALNNDKVPSFDIESELNAKHKQLSVASDCSSRICERKHAIMDSVINNLSPAFDNAITSAIDINIVNEDVTISIPFCGNVGYDEESEET